jgi:hypothetical protein
VLSVMTFLHLPATFTGGVSSPNSDRARRSISARRMAAFTSAGKLACLMGTAASSRLRRVQIALACAVALDTPGAFAPAAD